MILASIVRSDGSSRHALADQCDGQDRAVPSVPKHGPMCSRRSYQDRGPGLHRALCHGLEHRRHESLRLQHVSLFFNLPLHNTLRPPCVHLMPRPYSCQDRVHLCFYCLCLRCLRDPVELWPFRSIPAIVRAQRGVMELKFHREGGIDQTKTPSFQTLALFSFSSPLSPFPCTLYTIHYTLYTTPYTLHSAT
jgi:hypothetical protein